MIQQTTQHFFHTRQNSDPFRHTSMCLIPLLNLHRTLGYFTGWNSDTPLLIYHHQVERLIFYYTNRKSLKTIETVKLKKNKNYVFNSEVFLV